MNISVHILHMHMCNLNNTTYIYSIIKTLTETSKLIMLQENQQIKKKSDILKKI